MNTTSRWKLGWMSTLLGVALMAATWPLRVAAQDQDQGQGQGQDQQQPDQQQQDDPPSRVARLGYMQGSVSFQPAGESDWVQAVSNRPMTTGDKLWSDKDSQAEVELGSAVIRVASNSGFSFLNLDDRTIQIQLTSGSLSIRARQLDRDDVFEVDTPNQAFSLFQPGSYRIQASDDGTYTVVSVREGEGESTGNGQTYTVHAGQRVTFSGTDSLHADAEQIGGPDAFDNWAYTRDHRYDNSRSAAYVSRDVVGYEDLDENGDWRDDAQYGHVWYPRSVAADWAPYREGHWDWIAPWGWTWVDDASWGYAPFHYGRWVTVGGRWGWIAGPIAVRPVYAPALVVFIGGGGGFSGNVGWFPLGPREVYVPSYRVSRGYVNRVNVSNTTVNVTQVTNVYNTTIINKTTNVTNITYVNRGVRGGVTAVPQRTFASAQPVGRAVVRIDEREVASARVETRAAVAPSRESVLGARSNTAGRVAAPPAAVTNRQVIAKATPPPPPVPFARQQQALAAHPGQPLERHEVQTLRPANNNVAAAPLVKQAPPGKPATPTMGRPGNQPGQPANQPNAPRPVQPANATPGGEPAPNERPGTNNPAPPNNRPQPNRPEPNRPEPNRPESNRPSETQPNTPPEPNNRPQPNRPEPNRPEPNRPQPNRPSDTAPNGQPAPKTQPEPNRPDNRPNAPTPRSDHPPATQPNQPAPNTRPDSNRPDTNRPDTNRPNPNRPDTNRPEPNRSAPDNPDARPNNRPAEPPNRNEPTQRPSTQPPNDRAPGRTPPGTQPPTNNRPPTPEEKKRQDDDKKRQDEEKKRSQKPQPPPQ